MPRGWLNRTPGAFILLSCAILPGCQTTRGGEGAVAGPNPAHRARLVAQGRLAQDAAEEAPSDVLPPVPVRRMSPATQPATPEKVYAEVPDPLDAVLRVERELSRPDLTAEQRDNLQRNRERLVRTARPEIVRLSLAEAVRRTLQNNYAIQLQAYNPAIESTRIVEAEARFDAIFFTSANYNKQDRPTSSQLQGTESDTRVFTGGIRKLLSTGTQVQASYAMTRTSTNVSFQTLNPAYFNQFIVEFTQPLLRGFGLDFNRSQIELARLDRKVSIERLEREIRETLFNVEQAYWRLLQARRSLGISARLLTELEIIFESLRLRADLGYDVYEVQLNQTRTRIEQRQAEFIRLRNNVRTAEIVLKGIMNDPHLNQSIEAAIVPTDTPTLEPLMLDMLGEVTAGLNYRAELREARLAIEQAQIAIGVAKNQALPRLDLLFRYIIDGLGGNADRAFSQLSENDYNEYVLGLEFEWPIGNRGPEAALRRARLQQTQAIAGHRAQIENVITQVKQAVYDLMTNYEQIGPSFRAARASADQLVAIRARQERRDPPSLEVELNANEALANARQQLLQALIDYNIDIVNLERQKGTLLRFNNVVIRGSDDECYQEMYRPLAPESNGR